MDKYLLTINNRYSNALRLKVKKKYLNQRVTSGILGGLIPESLYLLVTMQASLIYTHIYIMLKVAQYVWKMMQDMNY